MISQTTGELLWWVGRVWPKRWGGVALVVMLVMGGVGGEIGINCDSVGEIGVGQDKWGLLVPSGSEFGGGILSGFVGVSLVDPSRGAVCRKVCTALVPYRASSALLGTA